jgi:GntR family transcriptional repressor for pyruvate dehydrogenase complex
MKANGLVEEVQRQLEVALLDGRYPANSKLPSERMLAEQFAVSRNTIREALQRMVARGLLRSRPGAGMFVGDQLRTSTSSPWAQLVVDQPALLSDVLEFRRVLEGATAYYAALRGTEEEFAGIRALQAALEQARLDEQEAAEAALDAQLHEAIALASHNSMFLHLHASVLVHWMPKYPASCCNSTAPSARPSAPAALKPRVLRCRGISTMWQASWRPLNWSNQSKSERAKAKSPLAHA